MKCGWVQSAGCVYQWNKTSIRKSGQTSISLTPWFLRPLGGYRLIDDAFIIPNGIVYSSFARSSIFKKLFLFLYRKSTSPAHHDWLTLCILHSAWIHTWLNTGKKDWQDWWTVDNMISSLEKWCIKITKILGRHPWFLLLGLVSILFSEDVDVASQVPFLMWTHAPWVRAHARHSLSVSQWRFAKISRENYSKWEIHTPWYTHWELGQLLNKCYPVLIRAPATVCEPHTHTHARTHTCTRIHI